MQYYGVIRSGKWLAHHGIKGQHWGVRNGPPYPLDRAATIKKKKRVLKEQRKDRAKMQKRMKKVYKHLGSIDRQWIRDEKRERKEAGVRKGLFSDRISNNSVMVRYTSDPNEAINNRRKYVSLLKNDVRVYKNDALYGGLGFDGKNDVYKTSYRSASKKGLKTARGDDVVRYIVKRYGDKSNKDTYKVYKKNRLRIQSDKTLKGLKDKNGKDYAVYDYAHYKQHKMTGFAKNIMRDPKKVAEITEHYRRRGYDAIVDPEDHAMGYSYPVIILDPKKSLVKSRSTRIKR